jgi:hypothetical protein
VADGAGAERLADDINARVSAAERRRRESAGFKTEAAGLESSG